MSPAWAKAVDDACVEMLEATSWRGPRDYLVDCPECGCPFWARPLCGGPAVWCSPRCRARYHGRRYYQTDPVRRARMLATSARWRAAQRQTRRTA